MKEKLTLVRALYEDSAAFGGKTITVGGWARSIRDSRAFGFIDLNDGTCFRSVQVVLSARRSRTTMRSPRRTSARR